MRLNASPSMQFQGNFQHDCRGETGRGWNKTVDIMVVDKSRYSINRDIGPTGMDEPKRKSRVKMKYRAQYDAPLRVRAGERVSVGGEDKAWPGWKWCRAFNTREGWIPVELL